MEGLRPSAHFNDQDAGAVTNAGEGQSQGDEPTPRPLFAGIEGDQASTDLNDRDVSAVDNAGEKQSRCDDASSIIDAKPAAEEDQAAEATTADSAVANVDGVEEAPAATTNANSSIPKVEGPGEEETQPKDTDWKLSRRPSGLPRATRIPNPKREAEQSPQTPKAATQQQVFTRRRFPPTNRRQITNSPIPKLERQLPSAITPKTPTTVLDTTHILEQSGSFVRHRPVNSATLSRINRIIRDDEEDSAELQQETEYLKSDGPFYVQRPESDALSTPRPRKTQKMKWTTDNDMMLLLFANGRDVAGTELKRIADWFPEKPTPKAIQERLTKLRAKTRRLLKDSGIYDSEEPPSRGSLSAARARAVLKDEQTSSAKKRPSKKARTSVASVEPSSPSLAAASSVVGQDSPSKKATVSTNMGGSASQASQAQQLAGQVSTTDLARVIQVQHQQQVQNGQILRQLQLQWKRQQQQILGQQDIGNSSLGTQSPAFASQQQQLSGPTSGQSGGSATRVFGRVRRGESMIPTQEYLMQAQQQQAQQQQGTHTLDPPSTPAQRFGLVPSGMSISPTQRQKGTMANTRAPGVLDFAASYQGNGSMPGNEQQQQPNIIGSNIPSSPPSTGVTPTRRQPTVNPYTGATTTNFISSPVNFPLSSSTMRTSAAQPMGTPRLNGPQLLANASPGQGMGYAGMAPYHQSPDPTLPAMHQHQQYPPFLGTAPFQQATWGAGVQRDDSVGGAYQAMRVDDNGAKGGEAEMSEGHGGEGEIE